MTSLVGDVTPESTFVTLDGATLESLSTMTSPRVPESGEPLITYNHRHPFCQRNAEWPAFRPDMATALNWRPDGTQPGTWLTRDGIPAVETVLVGRRPYEHPSLVGPVTAHLTATRGSYDDIEEAARESAHRAIHL
ncbi:hypothetical protein [Candidatus Poriferisodalis sp.]|uniref:hypothetical protein n=1 Tax=Candidatus Poriferisodalis sp. TaxID=3101277 RepID=UPI003B0152E1